MTNERTLEVNGTRGRRAPGREMWTPERARVAARYESRAETVRRLNYCQPWVMVLREAPDADVCADPLCKLSGGYSHVGDCEPCSCGLMHAKAECEKELK